MLYFSGKVTGRSLVAKKQQHYSQFLALLVYSFSLSVICIWITRHLKLIWKSKKKITRKIFKKKEQKNLVLQKSIMSISGHRSETSLRSYNNKPSSSQLHQCSNVLAQALGEVNSADDQPQKEPQTSALSLLTTVVSSVLNSATQNNNKDISLFSGWKVENVYISYKP